MAFTSWFLLGSAALCLVMVLPVMADADDAAQEPEGVKRVARSFGNHYNDLSGLSDPRLKQMIDWNQIFDKRSKAKRELGAVDGSNLLTGSNNESPYLQDWSTTFGRNYRSFDNSIPNFGGGLQPHNMQNWQNFVGRVMRKRNFGGAGGGGGGRRLGDYSAADMQNWRAFFQRAARAASSEQQ